MLKKSYQEIESTQLERSKESRLPLYGILENIRSLHNVGSIFRTADGAGFSGLGLVGITGVPPKKEIEKTALGAASFVKWQKFDRAAEYILDFKKASKPFLIALEHSHKSIPYTNIALPKNRPIILVVGNEISGIEESTLSLCDLHAEISMRGSKHSLNVSVAFGILAFHLARLLE